MSSKSARIKLAFTGDICLGLGLRSKLVSSDLSQVFSGVIDELGTADLRIGNLECCLVDGTIGTAARENPMSATLDLARSLTEARFDVLNLANNHILDCGRESLSLSLDFCRRHGINTIGAGQNRKETLRPTIVEVQGRRLAFLAFGDTEWYYARDDRPGIAPLEWDVMIDAIDVAKRVSDALIVMLHADLEFGFHPAAWRVRLARKIAEHGADLVIQHHPHVLQGIEPHTGSIIAYSIGNFVFDWYENEYMGNKIGVDETVILNVTLDFTNGSPDLSYQTIPVIIGRDGLPRIATGDAGSRILRHMEMTSEPLADPQKVQFYWYERCREEFRYQVGGLYWTFRDHGPMAFIKRVVRMLRRRDHRRWIKGLLSFGRI
jgi:poly-gamma-glutamate synthesis protein (capsule biosynthesis protein)